MPEKTERRDDKAVARTTAVIALMLLSTVALRGHLPGAERAVESDEVTRDGSGSFVAVVAMLALSILVIAISVVSQALRRSAAPGPGEPARELPRDRSPLRWRPLVIAVVVLLAWALLILLLMRWVPPIDIGEPIPPEPGHDVPEGSAGADPAPPEAPPEAPTGNGGTVFGLLAGATIALVVLSIAATVIGRRRLTPVQVPLAAPASAPTPPAGPDLARAAELGLAEMEDLGRDPREAIIACYLAMERELEKSPGTIPRDSDTPSEVLARAIEQHALPVASATVLVDLFEEARFSPHVMNEGHRADAMRALQSVQHDLQAAV